MIEPHINYLIPLPDAEERRPGSALQGFSESLLDRPRWIRTILSRCPPPLGELYRQSLRSLELRLVGLASYRILLLLDRDLDQLRIHPLDPFWVVLVDARTQISAEAWIAKQRLPIHLAVAPLRDDPSAQPELPTRHSVRQHCDAILDLLARSWPTVDIEWAAEARAKAKKREALPIEFGFTGHNVTIPNELLLMSVGGGFAGDQEPLVGDDSKYLARILQTADEAALVRNAIPAAPLTATLLPVPTVILAAPGIYRHARKTRPGKGQERLPVMRMLRKLQQQSTYSLLFEDEADMRELMNGPQSCALLQLRTLEQTAFTDALPVRFVDVRTELELVRALNGFDGALVVFDGHGRHRRDEDYGQLQLAEGAVNPWELRQKVRVPPIAFLCACDTHAYDRSHVTPGSGLLACGARAVISTVLPVHSHKAAVFAARLLFRIYDFLPQVIDKLRTPVRWDNAFSLLQRMMFVTEFLGVIPAGAGAPDWRQGVMSRATVHIHSRYDWYELFLEDIASATGQSLDEIVRLGKQRLSFPESLKYLHLGNPESIVILPAGFALGDLIPVDDRDNEFQIQSS